MSRRARAIIGPISSLARQLSENLCGRRASAAHLQQVPVPPRNWVRRGASGGLAPASARPRTTFAFRSWVRRSSTWHASSAASPPRTRRPSASRTTENKRDDPVWAPIFENFAPLAAWLAEKRPDVLLLIYNDHVTSFFFDHYSAFVLGVGPEWPVADEGGGARDLPPVEGTSAARLAHRPLADGGRVRHVVLPEPGARPRLLLAALDALPARAGMAGAHRSARRWASCSSRSRARVASTSSGKRCGARSKAIRRTCGSRSLRPAVSRTRCTASAPASTTRRGTAGSSISSSATRNSSPR